MRRKSKERPGPTTESNNTIERDIDSMNYEERDRLTTGRRARKVNNWIKLAVGLTCGLVILLLVYGIVSSSSSSKESVSLASKPLMTSDSTTPSVPVPAIAVIVAGDTWVKLGYLKLSQANARAPVTISGEISGLLPNALLGFHVHTYGNLEQGCNSTGTHFNPYNATHGSPEDANRHVGDLGNIQTNSAGVARVNIVDSQISLAPGLTSIIGRAFVVHSGTDDLGKGGVLESLTTGNAGPKYACGVIGIAAPT